MVGVIEQVGGCGRVAEELRRAAGEGDLDSVIRLLGLGAEVDGLDEGGFTPLQRASSEGRVEIVKYLLKSGADVNRQDPQHGNTPLHEASWKGFSQTAELLVKAKANVYLRNLGGFAPLHLACQNGHNQTCRIILLAGCKPDIKNNYGDTSVHTAARYGHAGVTRILLSARANVKEVNKNGDTALHIAAAMGRRKLTRMLLEAAADQCTKNKQGETPADIAARKDFNQILDIFRNPPPVVSLEERLRQEEEQKLKKDSARKGDPHSKEEGTKGERTRKDKRRVRMNDSGTSSKESGTKPKEKKKLKGETKVDPKTRASRLSKWGVDWSPYGCHVAPPNETKITSPKLKTLPTDPLSSGEQYFVDLAGNIKKGPVGVGSACYCAPLFQTVQHKMERDKIDLMDHIDAAHGKLGARISSLETETKGHIQKLGDTMQQKISEEREECRQRSEVIKENQERVVDTKLVQMQTWVERKLSYHHPDSPPSLRGKTFIGRRPSFKYKEYPLVRSRSEEAVSEIIREEDEEGETGEPLYKGLRVLDYPTSMYNIPQRVEDDCHDSFLPSKLRRSTRDDSPLSHLAFRGDQERQRLQTLLRFSEPEESSANECSTHKSSTISDRHDDSISIARSRVRAPLPSDIVSPSAGYPQESSYVSPSREAFMSPSTIPQQDSSYVSPPTNYPKESYVSPSASYPQESYVSPELNQAVGNLHVRESRSFPLDSFLDGPQLRPIDRGETQLPYQPAVPPDLVNRGDSRYNNFRNTNPYMYSLRDNAPYQPSHSHETVRNGQQISSHQHDTFPLDYSRENTQAFHVSVEQQQPFANDPEASTYLDMDRYRIQAAVRKLYNGYLTDGRVEPPKVIGKGILETSTDHDPHNDSGYSTRLCTASQGPSPTFSVLPPALNGGLEVNGRLNGRLAHTNNDYHHHQPLRLHSGQPPSEHLIRRFPESGSLYPVSHRRPNASGLPVVNGVLDQRLNGNDEEGPAIAENRGLVLGVTSASRPNGDHLMGESSLV